MASVNFLKLHGAGEVAAQLRHSLTDERLKRRHKNPDIDPSLTQSNKQWGGTYITIMNKYRDRILELDMTTNTNHRKDRVTAFALETAVPAGLPPWQEDGWCEDFVKHLKLKYGENFLGAAEHKDERHEYVDKDGSVKKSRTHIHAYIVPEIGGILNGKEFSSRKAMKQLNREIEDMTQKNYEKSYMTGGNPEHLSVEKLKIDSVKREYQLVESKLKDLRKEYKELAEEYNSLIDEQKELEHENHSLAKKILNREHQRSKERSNRYEI